MTSADLKLIQRDLINMLEGTVLEPGDLGFADTVTIDNGRIRLRPYLVAMPARTEDVVEIVKYCHIHSIPITTKAGGHSAAGYCLNASGIVMDLVDMNDIAFLKDGSQLSVGAGTRWIRAYDFLRDRQSNYTVIGGGCAGVGVAGFVLGGGYSFISRSYGLGCDNVIGLEFVSADGEVIDLSDKSKDDERELYRALRGAGGGNFGVITRIDLQLQTTEVPRLMMGQVSFPFYRINEVLDFYNKWVLEKKFPKEMAIYGMMRNFPDPRFPGKSSLCLRFTPVYNGPMHEGIELLQPLTMLKPNSVELYSMTLPEWENFVGTSTQVRGHSAYIRSLVFSPKKLTDKVAEICKFYLGRAPSPDSYVVWTHTGGKIRDYGTDTSSYAHRDGEFTFELKSEWASSQPLLARPNIEWAVGFFDELGRYAQGAYINYIDPLLLDWQKKYYRDEYAKLVQVSDRWDRNGQFKFQQGIGSDYDTPPRTTKPLDLSPLGRTFYESKK